MLSREERLSALLRAACGDALFAVLGSGPRTLEGYARRRAAAHDALARGESTAPPVMVDPSDAAAFDRWTMAMATASAPVGAPWFVPMRDAIDDGLSLDAEPRGLRAVLPIGGQAHAERIRRDGMLAVRIVRTVSAADGALGDDELRAIDWLLSALSLGVDDHRLLRAEGALPIGSLEIPDDLDKGLAKSMVAGAWEAAASDGLEEAERAAVVAIATRLRVDTDAVEAARAAAERVMQVQQKIGVAAVDAIRYVLAPLPAPAVSALVGTCVRLAIPPLQRAELLRGLTAREPTPLGRQHDLDRAGRAQVLTAAWAAVLAHDPSVTQRAALLERHDRVAIDLRAERSAEEARDAVEDYLSKILARGVALSGG